jgi:hypothetical protein
MQGVAEVFDEINLIRDGGVFPASAVITAT